MALRRQPYFLPTQITGCSLWLDAADSSTITQTSGNISQWADKSISALTATAVNSPTVVANVQNGFPGISFNGSTQYFNLGNNLNMGANQLYIFVVSKFNSTADGAIVGKSLYGGATGRYSLLRVGGILNPLIQGTGGGNDSGVNSDTNTSTRLLNMVWDRSTIILYQNGTSVFSVGLSEAANVTNGFSLLIGAYQNSSGGTPPVAGLYMNGYIHEILIYFTPTNSPLSSTQRQQVEGYLAQKWGLTASLPADHPGLTSLLYRVQQPFFTKIPYFTRFSPTQIPGLGLWFDATDSSTITLSSGSLTQWNDKSGNGRNLTAVSGFANATVSSAFQNGLNVFNFSGNGLYRTAAGNIFYPLDVYIVVALKSLTTHVDVLGMGDTAVDNFNSLTFAESAARRWHNGSSGGGRQTISTSDETSLSFLLIQWSIANGNYLLRRNGTQLIQASRSYSFNNPATSIFQIGYRHTDSVYGTSANFSGYIGEIVAFNNQIGTTERQQIESYLSQKWGLTSSLPADHLNATFPVGSPAAIQPFISRIRPALSGIPFVGGGGTSSSSGSFTIRTFTSTSQLILSKAISATILVVGGGGGGGSAGVQTGGGGAGGAVFVSSPVTITAGTYAVTVGTGGGINTNGTNSTFLSYTGTGGGGGGNWINGAGKTGGCGGGGSGEGGSGAAGSQGFGGANGRGQFTCGGGGGGMGQAGKQPADGSPSSGGNGLQYSITGSAVYYAGGGAGGFNSPSTGGLGGGGDKTVQGTDGLGGGGGSGARGGNGVVIISFVFI